MKYKIVVFDLDGTLVNSITDLANATNEGLRAAGLPTHTTTEYKHFVGNGRDKLVERAMGECRDKAVFDKVRKVFDSYYAVHCNDNIYAYDGCPEMLQDLQEMGVKTAVLSNKPDEFVEKILKKVYPSHKFTAAWGKKPGLNCKPDPESLLALLEECGERREECLYIGDSDVDVYTAQNAGVDILGVDWGFRGRDELRAAGAEIVVSKADEITEYVKNEH